METSEILKILQDDMGLAVISSVDADGNPHGRHINIGVANEQGVFFMTSPKTNFYAQLQNNQSIAITGYHNDGYLIQVIRIEGTVREIGQEYLEQVLKDNPYVSQVYPNEEERKEVQVFQLYKGNGFYHSLTQGHRYEFEIDADHQ